MGGTFDPIHHGHLVAAEEARCALGLERVVFIPAGRPWQKHHAHVSPPERRYEMALLATADNPSFEVSRAEIDRDGPTYTIETLRGMRETFPDAEMYFITGADAISQILTWRHPREALSLAMFVAVSRPGHDLDALKALGVGDQVTVLEIPALAISSTDIRQRVAEDRPIRYLVPEAVRRYIADQHLYRD